MLLCHARRYFLALPVIVTPDFLDLGVRLVAMVSQLRKDLKTMSQIYTDPMRENEPNALPDAEVWYHDGDDYLQDDDGNALPDSEPNGPFETEADAIADAQDC
jgi:hypothetical protein